MSTLRKHQFSVRACLILMTIGAVFCKLCVGMGWVAAIRTAVFVGYASAILAVLRHPGPRTEGALSCTCAGIFNLVLFCRFGNSHIERSFTEQLVAETAGIVLFGIWIVCALLAVRSRRYPNRAIGGLSLLSVISPGILGQLEYFQYIVCSWLGIEWWQVRPFGYLMEVLWFS